MFVEQVFNEVVPLTCNRKALYLAQSICDIQCYAHSVEEALSSIVVSDNLLTCCVHLAYLTSWSLILLGLLLSNVFMIVPVIQCLTLVLRGRLLGEVNLSNFRR